MDRTIRTSCALHPGPPWPLGSDTGGALSRFHGQEKTMPRELGLVSRPKPSPDACHHPT